MPKRVGRMIVFQRLLSVGLSAMALAATSAGQPAGDEARRGFLGLQYTYEESSVTLPAGRFRVVDLYPGGPAAEAGLRKGDLITAVNGIQFRFDDELDIYNAFSWVEPGARIDLSVSRGGSAVEVSLVADPEPESVAQGRSDAARKARAFRAQQKLRELAEGNGVEVSMVRKGAGEGFRAEIAGLDPELSQDIADLVGTRYLGIFGSQIKEGDRIELHFLARSQPALEPGSDTEAWSPPPAVRIIEAPPHIWLEEQRSPDGAEDEVGQSQ